MSMSPEDWIPVEEGLLNLALVTHVEARDGMVPLAHFTNGRHMRLTPGEYAYVRRILVGAERAPAAVEIINDYVPAETLRDIAERTWRP